MKFSPKKTFEFRVVVSHVIFGALFPSCVGAHFRGAHLHSAITGAMKMGPRKMDPKQRMKQGPKVGVYIHNENGPHEIGPQMYKNVK